MSGMLPSLTESQKINVNIITLNTAVNDLQHIQQEHHRILVEGGEGQLPLVEQVRNNTVFIREIKYWTKFVFGALILQTIAFLAGIVLALIRFLPVLESIAKK
jgi:hypothetical protein